jgi:hypothetical protein
MAKTTSQPSSVPYQALSFKAVAVTRLDGLQHSAYEITVENGVVTNVQTISRAPNLPGIVISNAEAALWILRDQQDFSLPKNT